MIKKIIKRSINQFGFDIVKLPVNKYNTARLNERPVGRMDCLLEDLKYRGLNCQSILDVGANRTNWSRMARKEFPNASYHLIEPQIEMKPHLEEFCQEFKNSSYSLAGAGSKEGNLILTIWDNLEGSSFLPKPDNQLLKSDRQREVEIITIDGLIESSQIEVPDLIKLDIQGFELEALKGAEKIFGITEIIILEVSLFSFHDTQEAPVFSDVIDYMLEKDYVVYDFPGFIRRPLDGALGQCDICFAKKNGFLRSSNSWN